MTRRPWTVVVLLAVAVAVAASGCGAGQEAGGGEPAGELAAVKADRDHLAALVAQLSASSATLEAYAVNDRKGCLSALKAVRRRIVAARADLRAGDAEATAAAVRLDAAGGELDRALRGDCAPVAP
jgi:hypothetical protein